MNYNLDDYFVNRPKPRSAIFYSLLFCVFVSWSYREGTQNASHVADLLFIISIAALVYYAAFLMLSFQAAKKLAIKRYCAYLSSLSQPKLQLLLSRPDLSPQSTKLVRAHLAQHYPFSST